MGSPAWGLAHVDRASAPSAASIWVARRSLGLPGCPEFRSVRARPKEGRTGSGPKGSRQKSTALRQWRDRAREWAAPGSLADTVGPDSFWRIFFAAAANYGCQFPPLLSLYLSGDRFTRFDPKMYRKRSRYRKRAPNKQYFNACFQTDV